MFFVTCGIVATRQHLPSAPGYRLHSGGSEAESIARVVGNATALRGIETPVRHQVADNAARTPRRLLAVGSTDGLVTALGRGKPHILGDHIG